MSESNGPKQRGRTACMYCGRTHRKNGLAFKSQRSVEDHERACPSNPNYQPPLTDEEKEQLDTLYDNLPHGRMWIDVTEEVGFYVPF